MGKQWKQWQTFFSLAPKSLPMVTAAMKSKDTFDPWKKSYDQPRQHIKKQRHYNKVHLVKAMVFPIVMYRCESSTIKKVEDRRTDVFELQCWRRFLRVSWTAKRSNKSILKEICPEYSLERLILMLILQSFDHLIWRTDLLEKDPDAGGDWRWEEKGMTEDEMVGSHHWLHKHEFEQAPGVGDGWGSLCVAVHGVSMSWTWLSDWTELICMN